jgi:hypothetical protein
MKWRHNSPDSLPPNSLSPDALSLHKMEITSQPYTRAARETNHATLKTQNSPPNSLVPPTDYSDSSGQCDGCSRRLHRDDHQPPHQHVPRQGEAVQVDPIKPKLKPPGTKRLQQSATHCFQLLLSNSTCARYNKDMKRTDQNWMAAPSHRHGGTVQVDPIRPTLKPLGTTHLKLKHNEVLFKFAFKFNLRRYSTAAPAAAPRRATPSRGSPRSKCKARRPRTPPASATARGPCPTAGAYTRPLFSSTRAVSDIKYTLEPL